MIKSYVISLKNRPERLESFLNSLPSDWQYERPIVYDAINGKLSDPPSWWKEGKGPWGCYKSHLNIIENHINTESTDDLLLLEDDVMFCNNFNDELKNFLEKVPQDADQIYLGGQHLAPPIEINDLVVRGSNVNRTHAYIITQKGLKKIYQFLNETTTWIARNHIDYHYGSYHINNKIIAYCPRKWLCGQKGGFVSDITNKDVEERWWSPNTINSSLFVVVLGLHRSGSSCISMMLNKLGVYMGEPLIGYEKRGGGEAKPLAQICEGAAPFPSAQINIDPKILEQKLYDWINGQRIKAAYGRTISGGKYPHLCAMQQPLTTILGDKLRVIHCDRPLEDSIDSLKRRSRSSQGWLNASEEQCENVQKWLWEEKNKFLSSMSNDHVLHIKYSDLFADAQGVVTNMIKFLGINPSQEQIDNAITHVDKNELSS
jgi:GR25 family glycosyltransferase involved in LPS biosynthesis